MANISKIKIKTSDSGQETVYNIVDSAAAPQATTYTKTEVDTALAKKPGEITTGKQYAIDGTTVTAGEGAEAFNSLTSNKAVGFNSHAEGMSTTASHTATHAEGYSTTASNYNSHAEGAHTTASGNSSHAEGGETTASGSYSHAECFYTTASGSYSHAEGNRTIASGAGSHAEGDHTKASSTAQHAQGKYNVEDANGTYAFIIGNGIADNARHNAFAVDWDGLIYVNGATTGVDISTLPPQVARLVDAGAKNLLNLDTTFTSYEFRGITYTNNHDGTIRVSGTSNANDSYVTIYDIDADNLFGISKGKTAIITSTSDNVSISIVPKRGGSYGQTVSAYKSSPAVYTIPSDFSGFLIRVGVYRNGTTVNEDVNGMICITEDYEISTEFVPYAKSNYELTQATEPIPRLIDAGAKNLLKNTAHTQTIGGVTFTMNSDGSITANGTKTNNDWLYLSTGNSLKAGSYILTSGGVSGNGTGMLIVVSTADSLGSAIMTTSTASGIYERKLTTDYTGLYFAIRIASGTVCNNVIFKPMLCSVEDYAISQEFVPYAMSNAELTAKEQQNEDNISLITMRKVYSSVHNTSTVHTYTMNVSDFNNSPAGTYLITLVTWSSTPSFSLYAASYSGNVTTYSNLTKIVGSDANINITSGVISCTTSGKIQIIAVQ